MSTHRFSKNGYLSLSGGYLNYYEVVGSRSTDYNDLTEKFNDWEENTISIGEYEVIPFGKQNNIPSEIQETVLPNSFAYRALNRKAELLIEQGPYIYLQKADGRKYFREPVENEKLTQWLESFNHEELCHNNAIDFFFNKCIYNKIYRSRSSRLGQKSSPEYIEHLNAKDCRLAFKRTSKTKKPTHVIIGDWEIDDLREMQVYPLYDHKNPAKYAVSIHYKHLYTYGMNNYPLPEIHGSLDWITNTTNTPKIFKAFAKNSLNIKWHIQSPAKFWEDKREIIKQNIKAGVVEGPYKEQMLEDLKTEILDQLSLLLSGVENVGKFWHNEYVVKLVGATASEQGWKITPIEQKTKEWVESQIKIYDTAIFAVQASLGVHASLLMVGADGKSDSGSEQLYAYVTHQKTATPIPEYYVLASINDTTKAKFKTKEKVGFYRTTPERMQDVSDSQRMAPSNNPKTPTE
ncbi:hypothetical protein [Winogradskyella sp.]|uniref:hypothetical protein n=1 Tax=Winogradskyella sp. TaxID=1883156 RepID=UPI003BAC564E